MVFEDYSDYYDLIYSEKDYLFEARYIKNIFDKFDKNIKTIFDVGCGTGKHAKEFVEMGFYVIGVDLSEKMIKIANKKFKKKNATFFVGDAKKFVLNKKVDAVISLFSVVGYHTTNDDIKSFLNSANKNLNKGGILIFDFWYGPAILTNPSTIRIKRVENDLISLTRLSEPKVFFNDNVVNVNYTLFIKNKKTKKYIEFSELHKVRYFFLPELKNLLEGAGFEFKSCWEFGKFGELSKDSWEACIIGVKK